MAKKKFGKWKAYYENQKHRTQTNKLKVKQRRERRLQKWLKIGVKKNGKPVLTLEQRKARLALRKELRQKRLGEQRPRPRHNNGYRGNNHNPRKSKGPRVED